VLPVPHIPSPLLIRIGRPLRTAWDWSVAQIVSVGFLFLKALGPERSSAFGAWLARTIGPMLPVNRIVEKNVRLAFPELDAAGHQAIVLGSWENLGRTACEYVHMDEIWDYDPTAETPGRIEVAGVEHFVKLLEDGKPALVFTAHLANWELPAVCAERYGLASAALYRTPNNRFIARKVLGLRAGSMGQLIASGPMAPFALAGAIERGEHVGLLVDQRFGRGPTVPFFGRPAPTNTLFARLARHFDCPVHGVRAIRLPGQRFRLELTDEIVLPRDQKGRVDVEAATALITSIVEGGCVSIRSNGCGCTIGGDRTACYAASTPRSVVAGRFDVGSGSDEVA
jgi:KDO2-lipid IV(A) lauroyltransferase